MVLGSHGARDRLERGDQGVWYTKEKALRVEREKFQKDQKAGRSTQRVIGQL